MPKNRNVTKDPYSSRTFFDGLDSYEDEYRLWKTRPPVHSLVGVFELPEDQFYLSIEESLSYVGKNGFSVVYYDSDVGRSDDQRRSSVGTGYACAVRNPYGKVQPVVFVRENINSSASADPASDREAQAAIRLLVLMHEMGHAEDIARGINFRHEERKLHLVAAEAYAHEFVCRYAKRLSYRVALKYYLDNIRDHMKSTEDSERLSAELAASRIDIPALTLFSDVAAESKDSLEARLEKAGRLREVLSRKPVVRGDLRHSTT